MRRVWGIEGWKWEKVKGDLFYSFWHKKITFYYMNNKSELYSFFRGILWLHCKNFISNKILYYQFIEINLSFCHVIFFKYWVISQFFKVEISIGQLGSIRQCFKVEISLGQLGLIFVYKISPMIDFEFHQSFLHTLRAYCMYITN